MTTAPDAPETIAARAGLLDRVSRSWDELQGTVGTLDEQRLTAPGPEGWSVKDHLAHLANWEQYLLASLEGRDQIAALGLDAGRDWSEDTINAELQSRDAGRSLAEVRQRLDETHAQVLARLRALDQAQLEKWLGHVEGNTHGHFDQHLAWIRALVAATP